MRAKTRKTKRSPLPEEGKKAVVDGWTVMNEGMGYGTRARRFDLSPATSVIVVEWTHPNYGYWADAGLYIRTATMVGWEVFPVVGWMALPQSRHKFEEDFDEMFEGSRPNILSQDNLVSFS